MRSDEDIRLFRGEFFQNVIVSVLSRNGVVVHAENPRGGKKAFQIGDDLLRARAVVEDVPSAALGARSQHMIFRAAIVALQTVFFAVVGERNVAVFALGDVAAVAAHDRARIAAAVQKYYRLIPALQRFVELGA